MDRRETIKSLLAGGIGGGLILTSCEPATNVSTPPLLPEAPAYGRTDKEKAHDAKLMDQTFFNDSEIDTIAVLCDLILPASDTAGSATEAGVPEFIEFIVKDITYHQTPMRGGLMWLDNYSNRLFKTNFSSSTAAQQKQILDQIAYPDDAAPELAQGVAFFSRIRNLVLTGYYTTRMGLDDLGYKGNTPNVWDGVPQEVLDQHGVAYDPAWLAKCVDQDKRADIAQWDDEGNLIS
ncbi:gluconate 2-dehydrogenase subunit 3 family protein [Fulvivirga sedimenti]|uniref:Gluconate 2-dehydrogenase subunit 3 family protein n=1 Tax=Fulvivirga sedimenti TaxID=2879465 RepID=A0A9X1HRM0_9BACT|nr:gluconate 2-dehydrogenase subunit 3 family protein [Fulvivirga sedimenti]MCA6074748.1 gluconate 2-dehydrogenase subunit 3 family protein [Fulvivirga sedimenti]MCA6075925.1 gluconate 2-dehydrogenase subunit 3 family protein [Fulvivirga sedimenti]MCA6077053.1 gluconate 2-dehydrogenase subunit 3 family protein [Fulvivirga sedimenti]